MDWLPAKRMLYPRSVSWWPFLLSESLLFWVSSLHSLRPPARPRSYAEADVVAMAKKLMPIEKRAAIAVTAAILPVSQRPRIDLNTRSLPRPKTTTAWKLIPHRSARIEIPHIGSHYIDFSRTDFYKYKDSFTVITFKLILILADIWPMGYKLSSCGSICSG